MVELATKTVANKGKNWDLTQLELRYFPLLSRKVAVSKFSKVSTTKVNLIYTVARAIAHPNNYKGNPEGVKKLACGISFVPKNQLLELLDIKQKHLYRLLELGVQFGFWRRFSVIDGWVFFSLRSPQNIAKKLGIEKVGAFAYIEPKDFDKIDILTTEMVALGFQNKTWHVAKLEAKDHSREMYTAGQLIFGDDSQRLSRPGKPRKVNQRYVAIDNKVQPFGLGLEKIAQLTGKSYSTVQKHLDNHWRELHGVHRLPKVQLAKLTNLTPDEVEFHLDQGEDIEGYSPERFLVNEGKVYFKSNNVYWDAAGFECRSFRSEDRERRKEAKTKKPKKESKPPKEESTEDNSDSDNNQDPPEDDSGQGNGGKPPRKVAQLIRDWEEAKGIPYQPQFFEYWEESKREAFLDSKDAYPYVDKDKNFVDPRKRKETVSKSKSSNQETYIHILDFAKAVSEAFRGKKG